MSDDEITYPLRPAGFVENAPDPEWPVLSPEELAAAITLVRSAPDVPPQPGDELPDGW